MLSYMQTDVWRPRDTEADPHRACDPCCSSLQLADVAAAPVSDSVSEHVTVLLINTLYRDEVLRGVCK